MKQSMKNIVLGSSTLLAIGAAGHVKAATTNVPINAVILAPVQITQNQGLNFGQLTEAGAGTATVDNTGARTTSASITGVGAGVTQGIFTLKATAASVIEVTAPASVTITDTASVATMTVNAFTIEGGVASAATPYVHTMAAATDTGLDIGGTLNIGAGQTPGTYTGAVTLTANYQ